MRQRAFRGLRKYQDVQRPPLRILPPAIAKVGNARLLYYGGAATKIPVVFIPSLINPPRVMDLSESRSMLRHMVAAGHDTYLVDWGSPGPGDAAIDLASHVRDRLVPLLADFDEPPILVGYCLGGTLAVAAALLRSVTAIATIATPWRFSAFSEEDRSRIAALWRQAKSLCKRLGYVPMEVLQSGFWSIDPARTVEKYAAFADMQPGSDAERAFLALEDWANEGPPLTFAAGRDLFELFYAQDVTGAGMWGIGDQRFTLDQLTCPSLSIGSSTDRIVPATASPLLRDNLELALGHVGMMVGSRAGEALWQPLSHWISCQGG